MFGFASGFVPLLRKGLPLLQSMKIVLVAEGLSIAVMEAFEVFTQLAIPWLMEASLPTAYFGCAWGPPSWWVLLRLTC